MEKGFKTWCENESAALRKRLGRGPRDPLPARELLYSLGAIVTAPRLIPGISHFDLAQLTVSDSGAWSAITTFYGDVPIVIVNDAHSARRQESNLHHEASHLICRHRPGKITRIGTLTLRSYDEETEDQASWLAGCLHLPRAALLAALRTGRSEEEISSHYVASAEMVRFRRGITGVDRQLNARRSRVL